MDLFSPFGFHIDYRDEGHEIIAIPQITPLKDDLPLSFYVIIDGTSMGSLTCTFDKWSADILCDTALINLIGSCIHAWYKK